MTWTGRICLVVANGVLQNPSDVFSLLDPDVGGASTFTSVIIGDTPELLPVSDSLVDDH